MARKAKESQGEAWEAVASSHGGTVVRDRKGKVEQVRFPHRSWTIVLDRYTVSTGSTSATYTRLRAVFEPKMPFRFRISRRNFFSGLGRYFGFQDVHTGRVVLDRDFIVRTDNESMLRSLLMDSRVGGRLEAQSSGTFRIAKVSGKPKPRPTGAKELRYETSGELTDPLRLGELVALFRSALDSLRALGAASSERVAYEL